MIVTLSTVIEWNYFDQIIYKKYFGKIILAQKIQPDIYLNNIEHSKFKPSSCKEKDCFCYFSSV